MEGFLNKKARGEKTIFARHEWSRRWFVLDGQILEYFESFDITRDKPINSRGVISLEGAIVLPISLAQHTMCFSVQLPGKQELILEADHDSLRKAWMDAISEACKVNRVGVARRHTMRAQMPQLMHILGLPPGVEPSLKQLNEAMYNRISVQGAAGLNSAELGQVREAHDRLLGLLLDEQEEAKSYWIEFQAEIIKGPPGEGLGVVVAENRQKHYLEVKEVLPCLKLRHLDEAAGGRLLRGDVLVSVNRDRVEHWPLRRVVHRVGDFRAPVGVPLRLGFRRKLLQDGCVPAMAHEQEDRKVGLRDDTPAAASGCDPQERLLLPQASMPSDGPHWQLPTCGPLQVQVQGATKAGTGSLLGPPPRPHDQHVLLLPLDSPLVDTPQHSSGLEHGHDTGAARTRTSQLSPSALVLPCAGPSPSSLSPAIPQGQTQPMEHAWQSVPPLLEPQSAVQSNSAPHLAGPWPHTLLQYPSSSGSGTAQDPLPSSCRASHGQQHHAFDGSSQLDEQHLRSSKAAAAQEEPPKPPPHPQVFIFSPNPPCELAPTTAYIGVGGRQPCTTPGTPQSASPRSLPHDSTVQQLGQSLTLKSHSDVKSPMLQAIISTGSSQEAPQNDGISGMSWRRSQDISPPRLPIASQWDPADAPPYLHEAARTPLPSKGLQHGLQSPEPPHGKANVQCDTQQLLSLPPTPVHVAQVQDLCGPMTAACAPQHNGLDFMASTGAVCLPEEAVPVPGASIAMALSSTAQRQPPLASPTKLHDDKTLPQASSQRAPCAWSDGAGGQAQVLVGSCSTASSSCPPPDHCLPTSLAQIEQQQPPLSLLTPHSPAQSRAESKQGRQPTSAAPQSQDGLAQLSPRLPDLPSRDGLTADWTQSRQVVAVPPSPITARLSGLSPSGPFPCQPPVEAGLSATRMSSSGPLRSDTCDAGISSGRACQVAFGLQVPSSTAQQTHNVTTPSTHQHRHQPEQQGSAICDDDSCSRLPETPSPQRQVASLDAVVANPGVRTVQFSTLPLPPPPHPSVFLYESSRSISPSLQSEARVEKRQHLVPPPLASVKHGPSYWLRGETLPVPPSTHGAPPQLLTPTEHSPAHLLSLMPSPAVKPSKRRLEDDGPDNQGALHDTHTHLSTPLSAPRASADPLDADHVHKTEDRRQNHGLKHEVETLRMESRRLLDEIKEDERRRLTGELLQARGRHNTLQAEPQRASTQGQEHFEDKETVVFLEELRRMALASAIGIDTTGAIISKWTKAGSSSAPGKLKRFEKLLNSRGVVQGA